VGLPPWRREPSLWDLAFVPLLLWALLRNGAVSAPALAPLVAAAFGLGAIAWLRLNGRHRVAVLLPVVALALLAALAWLGIGALPSMRATWLGELTAVLPVAPDWTTHAIEPRAGLATLSMGLLGAGLLTAAYVAGRDDGHRRIWIALAALGVVAALLAELHLRTGAKVILWGREVAQPGVASAPFVNANHLASYMACCLPLTLGLAAMRADKRWTRELRPLWFLGWMGASALVLKAGLDAGSRGFFLSASFGVVVFAALWFGRKKPLVSWGIVGGAVVAAGSVLLVGPARRALLAQVSKQAGESTLLAKLELWNEAGRLMADAPMLGYGLGSYRWMHRKLTPPWAWTEAHFVENELLHWGAEVGIVGLLLLLAALAVAAFLLMERGRVFDPALPALAGALAALAVSGLVDFFSRTGFGIALAGVLAGVLLGFGGRSDRLRAPVGRRLLVGGVSAALLFFLLVSSSVLGKVLGPDDPARVPGWAAPMDTRLAHVAQLRRQGLSVSETLGRLEDLATEYPYSAEPWIDLAMQHRRMGNWQAAIHAARVAEVNAPGDPRAPLLQARSLRNQGNQEEAVLAYKKALAAWPDDPRAFLEELAVYGLGAEQLIPLPSPPACGALRGLVESLSDSGLDWSPFAAMLSDSMTRCSPGSLAYCVAFARAARKAGRADWAVDWTRACLADRGLSELDAPELAAGLAEIDPEQALELYRKMLAARPGVEASLGLGRLLLQLGRVDEAADSMESVRRRYPKTLDIQRLWARAMVQAGRNALFLAQIEELDEGLRQDPTLKSWRTQAEEAVSP